MNSTSSTAVIPKLNKLMREYNEQHRPAVLLAYM